MRKIIGIIGGLMLLAGCGAKAGANSAGQGVSEEGVSASEATSVAFDADSAYVNVSRQVEFGPRVPNSAAHSAAADWLAEELARHGAAVTEQRATLRAFDGSRLQMRNIMGSFNVEAGERLLLLAHYDTRPLADQDPDPGCKTSR